jgi:hypothetical protein
MKKTYFIRRIDYDDASRQFVGAFDRANQCIPLTSLALSKRFGTKAAADRFLAKYDGAGYGLDRGRVAVVEEGGHRA